MIIVYGLFIYSIYEFLKFLFLATLGDIITTIKGNYDSPERDKAVKRICGYCKKCYCSHYCLHIVLIFNMIYSRLSI